MTAEQLRDARDAAWRQDGHALLTADDARAWLQESGLVLFLPRTAQIAAPAPTFVEATLGRAEAAPDASAIENASGLLRRLLASGDVLALNLLGTPGDQPDFLATPETLPFLFALHGDREWERGPRGRSTPLTVEVWKLLDREGALTAAEIKDQLGRQLTEAAALRALAELWSSLRVEPVYSDEEGTRWQRLEVNHERAMRAGSAMGQAMALSALVSLYLESVVAATSEEIEAFLGPLASRSRVRDAVRGLTATRQLGIRSLIDRVRGAQEHFYVEGSLPEFAETGDREARIPGMLPEVPATADFAMAGEDDEPEDDEFDGDEFEDEDDSEEDEEDSIEGATEGGLEIEAVPDNEPVRGPGPGRQRFVAQRTQKQDERRSFAPRTENTRKPFHAREPWKEDAPKKNFGRPRPAAGSSAPDNGAGERPRRPFVRREDAGARPFTRREPAAGERRPSVRREDNGGERKPWQKRPDSGGERRPFPRREDGPGERKPWQRREDGERRPFTPRTDGERKPFTPRADGERRSFPPRPGNERSSGFRPDRPFKGRPEGGDRKPFGDRPARPRSSDAGDRRPFSDRPGSGEKRPFSPRKPFGERPAGGMRPPSRGFTPRDGEERSSFKPRPATGGKSFGEKRPYPRRDDAGPSRPYERRERPDAAQGRPAAPREGFSRQGDRPFTPRRAPSGDRPFTPRSGDRPFKPRREDGDRPSRPFVKREGGPRGEGDSLRRKGAPGAFSKSAGPTRQYGAGARPSRPGKPPAGPGGKKPRTAPFTSSGKPRPGATATGRPGPRKTRPSGGPPKKFGGKRPGRDRE